MGKQRYRWINHCCFVDQEGGRERAVDAFYIFTVVEKEGGEEGEERHMLLSFDSFIQHTKGMVIFFTERKEEALVVGSCSNG